MNSRHRLALACFALVIASPLVVRAADNWPQWHGAHYDGHGADGDYPVEFSAEKGVTWKVALPGLGMSTPAVWDDHIFVTCGIDGKDGIVAYDFKGGEKWRHQFDAEVPGHRSTSSGSNPSPVTDGKHVVVYYGSGKFACLTLDGKLLWEKNLQDMYGKNTLWWDVGNSPAIAGNNVVVAVMQGPVKGGDESTRGPAYIAAFNIETGELAWKKPRQYERPVESDNAYTTPMQLNVNGKPAIVLFGADHLTVYDPASGELLFDLPGFNPKDEINFRSIASPAVSGDTMLIPFGRAQFLAGVRLNGAKPEILWQRGERGLGADVPTPVVVGDRGYVLTDSGHVSCLRLGTGDQIWAGDLPKNRNKYYSSPVFAGGKLYCAREDGVVFVVDATTEFKLSSTNEMGEQIIATPAPVRGGLLIRGAEHLFWISGRPQDSQTAG